MFASQTPLTEDELALLGRVAEWRRASRSTDLDADVLRTLSKSEGIDFATALLYDQIAGSSMHGPFIRRMEQLKQQRDQILPVLNATVAVVPGAFYIEYPETGADGRVIRDEAQRYGCRADLIPTPSLGSPAENGRVICDWLTTQSHDTIVLISLSKGGADVKTALAESDAEGAFQNVVAWVNLGGILDGSPMVNWLFSRKLLTLIYQGIFWLRGRDFRFVRELDRRPDSSLDFELRVPNHLRVIHVAGFPLRRHMSSPRARRWHRRLSTMGPNDSSIVLSDLCTLPGLIFPVWGTDHYLQSNWNPRTLVGALLHYLGEELNLFQAAPVNEMVTK